MRSRLLGRLCAALSSAGLWMAGCVVSPQPEPPTPEPLVIDVERLGLDGASGAVVLSGAPGAVTPGATVLRAIDLDSKLPEASVEVGEDGSFSVTIAGELTHVYRLQAFTGRLRSEPVDVANAMGLVAGPSVERIEGPLSDCLRLDPPLDVGPLAAGAPARLAIENGCAEEVALGAPSLRLGSPAWAISPPGAASVPIGRVRELTITYSPQAGAPSDDVLFIEVTAPGVGRRPISLRGGSP